MIIHGGDHPRRRWWHGVIFACRGDMDMVVWFISIASSPLYIGLGWPLRPPNTVHMNWETLGSSNAPNRAFMSPPVGDTGSSAAGYACPLSTLYPVVKWVSFPHTDSDFGIIPLVQLVWTRPTTPWYWSCIF
jgi:hypothetical protein